MSLTAKNSGADFVLAPEGTHPAVCVAVIDIGTHYDERFKKRQHKVSIGWELDADPPREDGEPHMTWQRYTVSLHEKAKLRKMLEAWRSRSFTEEELEGFDLKQIVSKGCLISIIHEERDGKKYANIAAVSALPKQMQAPRMSKEAVIFDIDEPDEQLFSSFSERLQDTIRSSDEWKARATGTVGDDAPPPGDDDVPF